MATAVTPAHLLLIKLCAKGQQAQRDPADPHRAATGRASEGKVRPRAASRIDTRVADVTRES